MKSFLFILLFSIGSFCYAQQFSYKPLNPAFGGETFNYNWLLSSATAQNSQTAPRTQSQQQSELERFGENTKQQILNQIGRILTAQQISAIGDLDQEGTFTAGDLNIEVFESDEGLIINILDTTNGEQTQIVVPNNP
ncbi:curli assembly protein CsgF [Lacinutrix salivirga]